ncbi:MAG: hypothetical protein DI616_15850 [Paracoccus denitrificans]|uniref:Uncharacterized protein n=1 Tax=Paracoccus denitrificans TaxID=266 RepID=A0A533I5A8_PARDE|nr:MAG: hypothetical protein DI616_15850 [Paracoccus denitrificans]
MHVVIMKNGEIVDEFHEEVRLLELTSRLKTFYVKYQTQDIYFRSNPEGWWLKATYKFTVLAGGGMHPKNADFIILNPPEVPKPIQMNDLVGAWK